MELTEQELFDVLCKRYNTYLQAQSQLSISISPKKIKVEEALREFIGKFAQNNNTIFFDTKTERSNNPPIINITSTGMITITGGKLELEGEIK